MRRQWLGLLMLGLLAFPSLAEGQCRKRILVYLDVSGSMLPVDRGASSPFQQTVTSLDALFNQDGFIESEDAVTVVRFGKSEQQVDTVEGRASALELIGRLRANAEKAKETDFRAAFNHLANTLPQGAYNQQVVLLASDFAHEPIDGMASAPAIADWSAALTEARGRLDDLFLPEKKTVMVLFQAQANNETRRAIAAKVVTDLEDAFSVEDPVRGSLDPAAASARLTATLRKSLFSPPDLRVSRDAKDKAQLAFTVTNQNCMALHVTRLSVAPASGGTVVHFELEEGEVELGASPGPSSARVIRRLAPSGTQWEGGVRATVETAETEPRTVDGTTGSWLQYKAASAVFEKRPLLSDVIRLDLDLTGFTDPSAATTYPLTVGDDASPLSQVEFKGPAFSDLSSGHYRIVLPMDIRGEEAEEIRVAISGAELLSEKGDQVALSEDEQCSHYHRIFGSVALLSALAVIFVFFWVRGARSAYPIFRLSRWDNFCWGLAFLVAFLLVVCFCSRVWILKHWSPEQADQWLGAFACVSVFGLTAFLLLEIFRTRFARSVVDTEHLPLRDYLRRGRLDTLIPWGLGLSLAAFVLVLLWPLRPAESPESFRSKAHTPLHVTSD